MKKIIYYLMLIIIYNICYSQETNTTISIKDKYLCYNIFISNNTDEKIIIPLYQWGFPRYKPIRIEADVSTYLINSIENFTSNSRIRPLLGCFDMPDVQFKTIPKFLLIEPNETKEIEVKIDTLVYFKTINDRLYDSFEFKISKADIEILYELFDIMKLDIWDYLVEDKKIEVILTRKVRNLFVCEKYNSGKKLKGEHRSLIRLPFIKHIKFYGTLEKNEE